MFVRAFRQATYCLLNHTLSVSSGVFHDRYDRWDISRLGHSSSDICHSPPPPKCLRRPARTCTSPPTRSSCPSSHSCECTTSREKTSARASRPSGGSGPPGDSARIEGSPHLRVLGAARGGAEGGHSKSRTDEWAYLARCWCTRLRAGFPLPLYRM